MVVNYFISFFIIGCLFYSANGLNAQVDGPPIINPSCSCPAGHGTSTIERNSGSLTIKFVNFWQNGASIPKTNKNSIIKSAFLCPGAATCAPPNFAKMQVDLSKPAFNYPHDERIHVQSMANGGVNGHYFIVRALQFRVKFGKTFQAILTDANNDAAETCTAADLPDSKGWHRVTCDFCDQGPQPHIKKLQLSFQQNTVVKKPKKLIKVRDMQIFICRPIQ